MWQITRRHFWIFFAALYALNFGLLLINPGIFWDDWILVGVDRQEVIDVFRQAGLPFAWPGYFHSFLTSLNSGIAIDRTIIFMAYFIASVCIIQILKGIRLPEKEAFFTGTLITLLPYNCARIALINAPYALCYVAFFLGAFIYLRKPETRMRLLISAVLFIFSFNTASFLVFFYALLIPFLISREGIAPVRILRNHFGFLIFPVIFYVMKNALWRPYGLYEGYNKLRAENFARLSWKFPKELAVSVFGEEKLKYVVAILLLGFIAYALRTLLKKKKLNHQWYFVAGGLFLIWAALFPYILVGVTPGFSDWDSRHQLLQSVGVSIVVLGFLQLLNSRIRNLIAVSIIVVCTFFNLRNYYSYMRDHLYQTALMAELSKDSDIKDHDTFIFKDKSKVWAMKRSFRFYEYSGMFRKIYHHQTKFGSNEQEAKYRNNPDLLTEKYNLKDYRSLSRPITFKVVSLESPSMGEVLQQKTSKRLMTLIKE